MDRADIKLGFLIAYVLAAALHAGMAWCILRRRSRHFEIQLFAGANLALAAWQLTQLAEYVFNLSRAEPRTTLLRALQGVQLMLALLVLVLFFHLFATFERVYRRQAPSLRAAITTHVHRHGRLYVCAAYLLLLVGGMAYLLDAGTVAQTLRGLRSAIGPTSAYLFGGTLLFMTFTLFPARPGQERILVPALARALLLLSLSVVLIGIAVWHGTRPRLTDSVLLPVLHLHSVLFCVFLALVRYEFSFMDRYIRDGLRLLAWTALVLVTYFAFNRIVFLEQPWGRYATSLSRTGVLLLAVALGPMLGRALGHLSDRLLFDRNVDLEAGVHRFSQRLAGTHTLQGLIDGAARDIARAVHAKSVRIMVSRSTTDQDVIRMEQEHGRCYRLRIALGPGHARVGWLLLGERRNLYPYFDAERRYLHLVAELLGAAVEALRDRSPTEPQHAQATHTTEPTTAGDVAGAARAADGATAASPASAPGVGERGPADRQMHVLQGELLRARGQARELRERFDPELVGDVLAVADEIGESDPPAALVVLRRLHSTYEYLRSPERSPTTLGQEMEFVQDYLALEKLRLRNRLSVSLSYDAALGQQEIPRRLLQPLIENALLHGLARELREGHIAIRAAALDGRCVITVEDNGRGFQGGVDPRLFDGEGGLARVRRWLHERFGGEGSLEIEAPAEEGVRLRITMPRRDLARRAGLAAAS
jgi:signal transduction histidine kinase